MIYRLRIFLLPTVKASPPCIMPFVPTVRTLPASCLTTERMWMPWTWMDGHHCIVVQFLLFSFAISSENLCFFSCLLQQFANASPFDWEWRMPICDYHQQIGGNLTFHWHIEFPGLDTKNFRQQRKFSTSPMTMRQVRNTCCWLRNAWAKWMIGRQVI